MPQFNPLKKYALDIYHLLKQAKSEKNPAEFFYKKKARTPLFMVESITRLLVSILESETTLKKEHKKIKKLEDVLGAMDNYDTLHRLFAKNKNINKVTITYFLKKFEKATQKLNELLQEKDYFLDTFKRLCSHSAINFDDPALIKKLEKQIRKDLESVCAFYQACDGAFNSMEDEVHEIRRNLRWVSIYAQSLDGIIVLKPDKKKYAWEKKFITNSEIKSQYNKVPANKALKNHIDYNRKAFLALSHVVSALGEIKDQGLQIEALEKAICKTSDLEVTAARNLVIKQLNPIKKEDDLFKEAYNLTHAFFTQHKIHEKIVAK